MRLSSSKRKREKDVVGIAEENSSDGFENVLSVTHCNVFTNEEWILDSGCLYNLQSGE